MRRYSIFCNMCGREIRMEKDMLQEGVLSVRQKWGCLSDKDGETHSFDLCEKCYDRLISQFKIPVMIKKETEFME